MGSLAKLDGHTYYVVSLKTCQNDMKSEKKGGCRLKNYMTNMMSGK